MDASRIGALAADCGLVGLQLSVAVRSERGVVGFVQGRWADGTPVTSDSRFYGASLAKQLTGALVALLVRGAGLDPDVPIGAVLPELPAWRDKLTVRHLLHHLGGLPDADSATGPGHWTTEKALGALGNCSALPAVPGSRYSYSNLGYVLLAVVIERISGVNFADFAQSRLFDPLGLTGIGFTPSPDLPQLAGMGAVHPLTQGDGGVWTTADAFASWLAHQNRDTLGIADLVQQPHGAALDYGWGIGLRTFHGHPLYIHGGGWPGACAKAVRCPALGLSIVALSDDPENTRLLALVDALLGASHSD